MRTLEEHMEDDQKALKGIDEKFDVIKNNHLAHIEVDLVWVKVLLMAMFTTILGLYFK